MLSGNVLIRATGVERTVVEEVYVHPVEPVKVVSVRPDRRWERRPQCGVCHQRAPLYDREHRRRWRSLDDGLLRVYFEALRAMILLCLAGYTRPLPGRT